MVNDKSFVRKSFLKVASGRKQPFEVSCVSAKIRGSSGRKEAANVLVMIFLCRCVTNLVQR